MTDERDLTLQRLFDIANQETNDTAFVDDVMLRINRLRRRVVIGWATAGLLLLPVGWLIAAPLQDSILLLSQILPNSLVELDEGLFAQVFAPINSFSAIAAVAILGTRVLYKKIFSN
jgi:hypothetical protein